MAITILGGASSPLGSWEIDYDDVGLTVGHTCDTTDPNARLVLTVIRVATFQGIWAASTTYAQGANVTGSDARNYVSLTNGNRNHDPVSDSGANWLSTTKDVTGDFGQGRIVDITGVPNSEVPPHVKGQPYPFLFSGTWTP